MLTTLSERHARAASRLSTVILKRTRFIFRALGKVEGLVSCAPRYFVMRAKAGIQRTVKAWVPAFAGTTRVENATQFFRSRSPVLRGLLERRVRIFSALRSLLLLPLLLISSVAHAHEPFEITTTVRMLTDRTELRLLIADSTTIKLCMPDKTSIKLRPETFESLRTSLEKCTAEMFVLRDGDQVLSPRKTTVSVVAENDLEAIVIYPPSPSGNTHFDAVHLKRLTDMTYGANFTATSENTFLAQKLLTAEQPEISVSRNAEATGKATSSSFSEFLHLGVEHILTGYDHLLFLAGLLIVCRRLRTALIIITSFTLAHSITLALAGLNIIDIPGSIIEPLIAATIVYVGLENIWRTRFANVQTDEPKYRWMLTFVFGLLHGFGFAGALRESGLPSDGAALIMPLFSFNLGVELGQIGVAAIFLPLLFYLHKTKVFARYGVVAISMLVSAAGAYWLLDRTVL